VAKPIKHRNKWRIRWLDETGRRQSAVFDSYREAERELRNRQSQVDAIVAGHSPAAPPAKTFDDLCDYWLAVRAPQKRKARDDQSIIRCHLRPTFGRLKLSEVTFARVEGLKTSRAHLARNTRRNILTLLGAMLRVAIDLGWLARLPKIVKPRTPDFGEDYSYLRTDAEVRRFLIAARDAGEAVHVLYAAALYTGMRQGELAGLRWEDVDFDKRLITVQRSFTKPTKARRVRYVPILNPLLPPLRRWRLATPGRLVFPNNRGRMHQPAAWVFQERLHKVLDGAGFDRPEPGSRRVHYIRFHDLRHTFASHWVMKGGDIFKLQKILGHQSMEMTQRYAHLAPAAFSSDLDRFDGSAEIGLPDDQAISLRVAKEK